jgi:hypothetical protein
VPTTSAHPAHDHSPPDNLGDKLLFMLGSRNCLSEWEPGRRTCPAARHLSLDAILSSAASSSERMQSDRRGDQFRQRRLIGYRYPQHRLASESRWRRRRQCDGLYRFDRLCDALRTRASSIPRAARAGVIRSLQDRRQVSSPGLFEAAFLHFRPVFCFLSRRPLCIQVQKKPPPGAHRSGRLVEPAFDLLLCL